MYSTALAPNQGGINDVAVSGWTAVGAGGRIPIGNGPMHSSASYPMPTVGYQYPIVPNAMPTLPAAPSNVGPAVAGNNFYSAWPPDRSRTYGVGILFSEKFDQLRAQYGFFEIYVKGIYQGSPADRSGMITEGDSLVEVNGENIRGMSLREVAPKITGPLNTPVQLGFKPGKSARDAGNLQEYYTVDLVRSSLNAVGGSEGLRGGQGTRGDIAIDPVAAYGVADISELASVGFSIQPYPSPYPGTFAYAIAQLTPGSDAAHKGFEPGDVIRSIDGKHTTGLTQREVKVMLMGKEGDHKDIEFSRATTGKTETIAVTLDCAAELPQTRDESEFLPSNVAMPQMNYAVQPQQTVPIHMGTVQMPIQPVPMQNMYGTAMMQLVSAPAQPIPMPGGVRTIQIPIQSAPFGMQALQMPMQSAPIQTVQIPAQYHTVPVSTAQIQAMPVNSAPMQRMMMAPYQTMEAAPYQTMAMNQVQTFPAMQGMQMPFSAMSVPASNFQTMTTPYQQQSASSYGQTFFAGPAEQYVGGPSDRAMYY